MTAIESYFAWFANKRIIEHQITKLTWLFRIQAIKLKPTGRPHPPNRHLNRKRYLFNPVLTVDSMTTSLMTAWCILAVTSVVTPLMMSQDMSQSSRKEEEWQALLSPLNPQPQTSVKFVVAQYTPPLITHQSISSNSPLKLSPQKGGVLERTNSLYHICAETCQRSCLASWQWVLKKHDWC